MNCNCISETAKRVAELMREKAGVDAEATCLGQGIVFASPSYSILSIPFRVRGSKKGFTSEKGKEVTVAASYCPFCGEKCRTE
jgi:hypothetical protein